MYKILWIFVLYSLSHYRPINAIPSILTQPSLTSNATQSTNISLVSTTEVPNNTKELQQKDAQVEKINTTADTVSNDVKNIVAKDCNEIVELEAKLYVLPEMKILNKTEGTHTTTNNVTVVSVIKSKPSNNSKYDEILSRIDSAIAQARRRKKNKSQHKVLTEPFPVDVIPIFKPKRLSKPRHSNMEGRASNQLPSSEHRPPHPEKVITIVKETSRISPCALGAQYNHLSQPPCNMVSSNNRAHLDIPHNHIPTNVHLDIPHNHIPTNVHLDIPHNHIPTNVHLDIPHKHIPANVNLDMPHNHIPTNVVSSHYSNMLPPSHTKDDARMSNHVALPTPYNVNNLNSHQTYQQQKDGTLVLYKPETVSLEEMYGDFVKKMTMTVLVPFHTSKLDDASKVVY